MLPDLGDALRLLGVGPDGKRASLKRQSQKLDETIGK